MLHDEHTVCMKSGGAFSKTPIWHCEVKLLDRGYPLLWCDLSANWGWALIGYFMVAPVGEGRYVFRMHPVTDATIENRMCHFDKACWKVDSIQLFRAVLQ